MLEQFDMGAKGFCVKCFFIAMGDCDHYAILEMGEVQKKARQPATRDCCGARRAWVQPWPGCSRRRGSNVAYVS